MRVAAADSRLVFAAVCVLVRECVLSLFIVLIFIVSFAIFLTPRRVCRALEIT